MHFLPVRWITANQVSSSRISIHRWPLNEPCLPANARFFLRLRLIEARSVFLTAKIYGCTNLLARFADTFGRGDWCSFVDLQPDGIFLLPLGAARSSPHHRSESVRWGAAAGRMGHLYTRSVCLSGAHWTYSERAGVGLLSSGCSPTTAFSILIVLLCCPGSR